MKEYAALQEMKFASNKAILHEYVHCALNLVQIFLAVTEHLAKRLNLTLEKFIKCIFQVLLIQPKNVTSKHWRNLIVYWFNY